MCPFFLHRSRPGSLVRTDADGQSPIVVSYTEMESPDKWENHVRTGLQAGGIQTGSPKLRGLPLGLLRDAHAIREKG